MTRIAVIGAGQTGATAALGLLNRGHEVSLYSDRSPQNLFENTPATGTAVMYGEALAVEARLGMNTYRDVAPPIDGITGLLLSEPGMELMRISGEFGSELRGVGVDTRIRSFDRMNEFIRMGGRFVVDEVTTDNIDDIAAAHDLTLVSTGKGGLSAMFARDDERSDYTEPQRYLAMITVTGLPVDETAFTHRSDAGGRHNALSIVGGLGESIWCPYLHKTNGPSWSFLALARPGTEWEARLSAPTSADEMLTAITDLHREYLPWDAADVERMEVLTSDRHSWLKGRVLPIVREAVGHTPGGRAVMSLGDTSIAFDPIGAQGAQSGIKQAGFYVDAIADHDGPFDAAWMAATFDGYYERYGRAANLVTKLFLEQAAGGPVNELLITAAAGDSRVASALYGMLATPQRSLPIDSVDAALAWISRAVDDGDPQAVLDRAAASIADALRAHTEGRAFFARPELSLR
ncbi:cadherin repeat domain-containing protein [Gordonia sp. TBRC 11910]|uniref:Cadherin repeat domain-containing protein n=1 Tax=Gordonia asplenii TaxID=2725283 RepID=A0A848KZ62_9ACTN|nr:styrene monooxygenase/indole monooxygenase family protein [Gordonia asplenii]NMO01703.1 cadherin repeat domain-containing protein [Gordonia asplenii]